MIRPFYSDGASFYILDQRKLPKEETWIKCENADDVSEAIKTLAVRGAPAIGIAAAYGLALSARTGGDIQNAADVLVSSRPTAVNLSWAVRRVISAIERAGSSDAFKTAKKEAEAIWVEEARANKEMSRHGADLFAGRNGLSILTHCNAGSLATGGIGTALGVIRELHDRKQLKMVYADETRPLLQGGRLTAYELKTDNIPVTLIADSMAGWLMKQKRIDAVITGADRIAGNMDTANKIGTYSLAVLAHSHGIPFYIAAPMSTFDHECPSGEEIPIEERAAEEVTRYGDIQVSADVPVYNPAFDVTPHNLITAIITEDRVFKI
jgi:methylthioribose-1-phosphate isomerase